MRTLWIVGGKVHESEGPFLRLQNPKFLTLMLTQICPSTIHQNYHLSLLTSYGSSCFCCRQADLGCISPDEPIFPDWICLVTSVILWIPKHCWFLVCPAFSCYKDRSDNFWALSLLEQNLEVFHTRIFTCINVFNFQNKSWVIIIFAHISYMRKIDCIIDP